MTEQNPIDDGVADTLADELALDRLMQSRAEHHRNLGRAAGERWALESAAWEDLVRIRDAERVVDDRTCRSLARASQRHCLRLLAELPVEHPAELARSGQFAEGFIYAADQVRERVELLVEHRERETAPTAPATAQPSLADAWWGPAEVDRNGRDELAPTGQA